MGFEFINWHEYFLVHRLLHRHWSQIPQYQTQKGQLWQKTKLSLFILTLGFPFPEKNFKLDFFISSLSEWMALKFRTIFSLEPFHSIARSVIFHLFKFLLLFGKQNSLHWEGIWNGWYFTFLKNVLLFDKQFHSIEKQFFSLYWEAHWSGWFKMFNVLAKILSTPFLGDILLFERLTFWSKCPAIPASCRIIRFSHS